MRLVYRRPDGSIAEAQPGDTIEHGIALGVWIDGSFHGRMDADVPRSPAMNLRAIRESLALTQGELAARMGTSTANVSRWERGIVGMSAKVCRKLQIVVDAAGGRL
jgi:DNA-binding XRE family transcriptional regulator